MFDFHADLSGISALLERLVQAIERLSPPPTSTIDNDPPPVHQSTLDDLHTIDDETAERAHQERSELAARFGVVVNSPAFDRAMQEYEQEMRRLHGEGTEIDWNEAYKRAQGFD
jgi:hypothetical protein